MTDALSICSGSPGIPGPKGLDGGPGAPGLTGAPGRPGGGWPIRRTRVARRQGSGRVGTGSQDQLESKETRVSPAQRARKNITEM